MVVAAGLTFNLAGLTETRPFFTDAPVALIVANTTICTLLIAGKICKVSTPSARREASGVTMSTFHTATVPPQSGDNLDFKTGSEANSTFDYPPQQHSMP
ncbi:hypothetical protein C0991_005474 [Blastosporella zonata]|nr:hypothetical protein C0991_005474 [Blastosporella zonata]